MVQATSPNQQSGRAGSARSRGDFRVGASHDAPVPNASTKASVTGTKLPPIQWPRTDYRKIMIADLVGTGKSMVVAILAFAVLTGIGVGIAVAVATLLAVVGVDTSSMY
ncbi:hypothetical protein [Actinoplanes xinjiangensis]|uniref:hypothetical protein n=1 Tax=Actinoplanes xinjiangensis TaxID=512350 RepID=UPI00341D404B